MTLSSTSKTTRSRHFAWRAWETVRGWSASRNALTIMKIEYREERKHEDGLPYVLTSYLPGHTGFTQGFLTLAKAQERADKRWEEWIHAMGLKPGSEWLDTEEE